jgi:hypothetical protein
MRVKTLISQLLEYPMNDEVKIIIPKDFKSEGEGKLQEKDYFIVTLDKVLGISTESKRNGVGIIIETF